MRKTLLPLLFIICSLFFSSCRGPMESAEVTGLTLRYYTVEYDANGGEGEMENSTFAIGFWERLEANTFAKQGLVFSGWSRTAVGLPEYADRDFVRDLSTTQNGIIRLYAVCGPLNSYTVSYQANGGEGYMPPSQFILGQVYALAANAYFRTGYTFDGWAEEEDGAAIYSDWQIIVNLVPAGETVYLYAVWKPITYTIIYDANGGIGTMTDSIFTYDAPKALTLNAFTSGADVFMGWSSSPEETAAFADGEIIQNLSAIPGDIVILRAVWHFTVTFNAANNSPAITIIVSPGEPVSKPPDPENTYPSANTLYAGLPESLNFYFPFAGWYSGGEEWHFNSPVIESITLTAQWAPDPENIPIDLTGINAETGDTIIDKTFAYVNANRNVSGYTLVIVEDVFVSGNNDRVLRWGRSRLNIYAPGDIQRTIQLVSPGAMFTCATATLTLGGNINLVGWGSYGWGILNPIVIESNNSSVVVVTSNAYFVMQGNASVSGNLVDGIDRVSGGVSAAGGSFTMLDNATVFGNSMFYGHSSGGVYVADGSFIMYDNSSVSGNLAYIRSSRGDVQGGVYVENGSFIMKDNTSVSENTIRYESGLPFTFTLAFFTGGVHIADGSFIMQGNSSVSGNRYINGGGFLVFPPIEATDLLVNIAGGVNVIGGSFIMQDSSSVSGNSCNVSSNYKRSVGGVHVLNGSFRIAGGVVYGNDAEPASLSNDSGHIDALIVNQAVNQAQAQYGSFDGANWTGLADIPVMLNGSLWVRNETIKVANGALVPYP